MCWRHAGCCHARPHAPIPRASPRHWWWHPRASCLCAHGRTEGSGGRCPSHCPPAGGATPILLAAGPVQSPRPPLGFPVPILAEGLCPGLGELMDTGSQACRCSSDAGHRGSCGDAQGWGHTAWTPGPPPACRAQTGTCVPSDSGHAQVLMLCLEALRECRQQACPFSAQHGCPRALPRCQLLSCTQWP